MGKSLVIVESPAKAKTLKKYLGKDFSIKASVGHLIDLPKKTLGVDVDNDFKPTYDTISGKNKILQELKTAAKTADDIYLAPDPDREGEAIAWHIANVLDGKQKGKLYRVMFNQITKKAVTEAIKNPGEINKDKVDAQQARRILDRLVGYKISPILWKKVKMGLSAGRVQSVALRLICDREKEIQAFVQEEYWTIKADMKGKGSEVFEASLFKISGGKPDIANGELAAKILADLKDAKYSIEKIQKKERKRQPVPPFITSTLQQEASRKYRFSAKKTMTIAQKLYEGIEVGTEGPEGLITYMRTDSVRIADEAIAEVRDLINEKYGKDYLPKKPNAYKGKKGAQDAHEAIRPTSVMRDPQNIEKFLEKDELKLYKLVWNRFVASQMTPTIMDTTSVDIKAKDYLFRANGNIVKFMGFMQVYTESSDDEKSDDALNDKSGKFLPPLKEGEALDAQKVEKLQHFTQPPARYSESTLIKELEEKGIGRPSTYASIMTSIRGKDYVSVEERRFKPSELGVLITGLLVESFPKIMDVEFTANMEDQLDSIEEGKKSWTDTLKDFYIPFEKNIVNAESNMRNIKAEIEPTDEICEKCGGQMGIRWGKFGKFLACMSYPECKSTKRIEQDGDGNVSAGEEEKSDQICDKCGGGMVVKVGRFGKFVACEKYPECKSTQPLSTGVNCPECNDGFIAERKSKKGRVFYSCNKYPKCTFSIWNKPVQKECPDCKYPFLVEKWTKDKKVIQCGKKDCIYKVVEDVEEDD